MRVGSDRRHPNCVLYHPDVSTGPINDRCGPARRSAVFTLIFLYSCEKDLKPPTFVGSPSVGSPSVRSTATTCRSIVNHFCCSICFPMNDSENFIRPNSYLSSWRKSSHISQDKLPFPTSRCGPRIIHCSGYDTSKNVKSINLSNMNSISIGWCRHLLFNVGKLNAPSVRSTSVRSTRSTRAPATTTYRSINQFRCSVHPMMNCSTNICIPNYNKCIRGIFWSNHINSTRINFINNSFYFIGIYNPTSFNKRIFLTFLDI